jgi:hypothetical protein
MQQNGILKNPTKVRQETEDICAQKLGFKNENDRYKTYKNDWKRNKRYNTGEQIPMSENPYCAKWFGEFIAENYVMKTFEDPIKAPLIIQDSIGLVIKDRKYNIKQDV